VADVFLSYARADQEEAERLVAVLGEHGFSVWWDPALVPGEVWDEAIQAALKQARSVVVLWSAASVSRHWVKAEATDALERGVLVPVKLTETELPLQFRHIQTADLVGWRGAADDPRLELLVSAIRHAIRGSSGVPAASFTESPVNYLAKPSARASRPLSFVLAAAGAVFGLAGGLALYFANRGSNPPPLGGHAGAEPAAVANASAAYGVTLPSSTAPTGAGSEPPPSRSIRPLPRNVGALPSDSKPGPKCTKEICDCIDNDCNGSVDDGITCSCPATGVGVCTQAVRTCEGGKPRCVPAKPGPEICANGLDDDCDGSIDESCIAVTNARIGCLDIQTSGNLTPIVAKACNGLVKCSYKAPTEAEYRQMGVSAKTRSFCTQAMEITYRCGSGKALAVNVPGDAWQHPPAQLSCVNPSK
jgi:hypothetical protein